MPGWYLLVAVVVLPALLTAGWRGRAAVLVPAVAGLALLVALDAWSIRSNGWFSQGRYALPVTAGVVPLAAAVGWQGPRWLAVVLAAVTIPAQVAALATVTGRYQVPAAFPLACALAGGLLLVAAVARADGHVPAGHPPGVGALTPRSTAVAATGPSSTRTTSTS